MTGAGATFPFPLYSKMFDEYNTLCKVKVNYQSIGSGGGIRQLQALTVDFGGSDGIMTAQQKTEAKGGAVLHVPIVAGAVAVIYNLSGVSSLKLDPDVLADIYLKKINKWNDPRIAALNAGVTLPSTDIAVVHRSDGSGTTFIFTSYLSAVSSEWKSKIGAGTAVNWKGDIGGQGNEGVANQVKQIPGGIGYVELAYARQNKLSYAQVKNSAGKYLEPSLESAKFAADVQDLPDNMEVVIVNSANANAYPIVGFTWLLIYENQTDAAKADAVTRLAWWMIHDGQKFATPLDYVALEGAAVSKAENLIKLIKVNGQPAAQFPGAAAKPLPTATPTPPPAIPTPTPKPQVGACPTKGVTEMTGAGATFPFPLYSKMFDEYNTLCKVKVNYQSIGSGGGIRQLQALTVDFGGSDGIMTAQQKTEAKGGAVLHVPIVAGAVAVIYNLSGVSSLKLDPDVLADIYLKKINKWNDPRIAALNAGVTLPSTDIAVVHRSDGSGTTFIFTSYLSAVSSEWKSKIGAGTAVNWKGDIGGQGNEGVANQVKQIPGGIGYVELAYARQNKLSYAQVKNSAGKYLEPSLESAKFAADVQDLPDNMEVVIVNSANANAYPIVGFTWLLIYENQTDAAKADAVTRLAWWMIHDGQKFATPLDYVALEGAAVSKAENLIKLIKVNGQRVLP
jgi:phosphate transport system substrate-binding protein